MLATNINMMILTDTIYYDNTQMMAYRITYPQLETCNTPTSTLQINDYYTENAHEFEQYILDTLLQDAIKQYGYSKQQNLPFHSYEVIQNYTVTYHTDCFLSLYYDQYIYTGGAHGTTTRHSNTWKKKDGTQMSLCEYFPTVSDFKKDLIRFINCEIDQSKDTSNYFKDYRQLLPETFNERNYYLTPNGIIIYFQQYDIAPYSSGILEFLISFCG